MTPGRHQLWPWWDTNAVCAVPLTARRPVRYVARSCPRLRELQKGAGRTGSLSLLTDRQLRGASPAPLFLARIWPVRSLAA